MNPRRDDTTADRAADTTEVQQVTTDQGPARLLINRPIGSSADRAGSVRAVLVLGHGAGGGPEAVDLVALAARLPARGIEVVRMEQPWRLAGKRIAPRPAALDQAWTQALTALSPPSDRGGGPQARRSLIVGGRSAGARVACRTAAEVGAMGCLALAFPLHPPGKADDPSRDRSAELADAGLPSLVLQGERDPFGGPDAVRDRVYGRLGLTGPTSKTGKDSTVQVVPVPEVGHELTVAKKATVAQSDVLDLIENHAVEWIEGLIDRK